MTDLTTRPARLVKIGRQQSAPFRDQVHRALNMRVVASGRPGRPGSAELVLATQVSEWAGQWSLDQLEAFRKDAVQKLKTACSRAEIPWRADVDRELAIAQEAVRNTNQFVNDLESLNSPDAPVDGLLRRTKLAAIIAEQRVEILESIPDLRTKLYELTVACALVGYAQQYQAHSGMLVDMYLDGSPRVAVNWSPQPPIDEVIDPTSIRNLHLALESDPVELSEDLLLVRRQYEQQRFWGALGDLATKGYVVEDLPPYNQIGIDDHGKLAWVQEARAALDSAIVATPEAAGIFAGLS